MGDVTAPAPRMTESDGRDVPAGHALHVARPRPADAADPREEEEEDPCAGHGVVRVEYEGEESDAEHEEEEEGEGEEDTLAHEEDRYHHYCDDGTPHPDHHHHHRQHDLALSLAEQANRLLGLHHEDEEDRHHHDEHERTDAEGTRAGRHAGKTHAAQEEEGTKELHAERETLLSIQRNPTVRVRAGMTYHLLCPVGVDIGGSLAKMAYFRPPNPPALPSYVNVEKHYYTAGSDLPVKPDISLEVDLSHGSLGGVLKFLKFPSANVVEFVDFILCHNLHAGYGGTDKIREINCTGGGAYKFQDIVKEKLGIQLLPCDEMKSMIRGLNFLLRNTKNEIFCFNNKTKKEFIAYNESEIFPYLLVSCGSGVSILLVKGDDDFERVSGSAIGGATFYGLCRMLTGLENFEDIQLSGFSGNHENIDLLVGDIYGGDLPQFGLSATTVASHFGKAAIQFPRASNNSARTQVPDYIEESQLYTAIPKTFSLNNQRKRSYSLAEPLANPTSGLSASSQPNPHRTKTGQKKHPRQPAPQQQQHVCTSLGCPCALAQGKKSSSYSTLPSYSTDSSVPNVPPAASSSGGFPVHSARHAHRRKSTTNASPSPPMPRSHSSSDIESPWQKDDIVQALMYMVCSNIAQLAYLNAKHYNLTRVFFSGGFVRNNPLLWNKLSSSIDYWSKGKMRAHFLLHDGYLGALGTLLSGASYSSSSSTPERAPPPPEGSDGVRSRTAPSPPAEPDDMG